MFDLIHYSDILHLQKKVKQKISNWHVFVLFHSFFIKFYLRKKNIKYPLYPLGDINNTYLKT